MSSGRLRFVGTSTAMILAASLVAGDAKSGELRHTLADRGYVTDLAFSPDSKWLATVPERGRAEVIEFETERVICSLDGEPDMLTTAFHPDGKTLITGHAPEFHSGKPLISYWDLPSGRRQKCLVSEGVVGVLYLSVSKDARLGVSSVGLAEFLPFPNLQIWDLMKGCLIADLEPNNEEGWATRVDISPSGEWIASVAEDSQWLVLRKVRTPKRIAITSVTNGQDSLQPVYAKFSPDGKSLAVLINEIVPIGDLRHRTSGTIRVIEIESK